MLTRKDIEEAPPGITYVTLGHLKQHMGELADTLESIFSGDGAQVSDKEFRSMMIEWKKSIESDFDELFKGMNYLGDILKERGMIPADKG